MPVAACSDSFDRRFELQQLLVEEGWALRAPPCPRWLRAELPAVARRACRHANTRAKSLVVRGLPEVGPSPASPSVARVLPLPCP